MSSDVPSRNTRSRRLGMGGAGTDGAKATDSAKDSAAQDKPSSHDEVCSSHPLRDAAIPHTVSTANTSKAAVGTVGSISVAHKGQTTGIGPGLVSQGGNNPTGSANADEMKLMKIPRDFHLHLTLKTTDKTRKDFFKPDKLTKEQKATVKAAEQRMTPAQREIINNQNIAIQKQQQARSYSKPQEVGPSSYVTKGKFVDHNNEVCDAELNIEVQKAELNHWNTAHGSIGAKNISSDVEPEISDKSRCRLHKNYHHKNGSQRRKSRDSKSEHSNSGTDDSVM
ncbi:hypothetical protein GG344DRAFT_71316, partial [Lentinula edodes]